MTYDIIARTKDAIYLRIPNTVPQTVIECSCPFCKAHPEHIPTWDTICVPTAKHERFAHTVHMPKTQSFKEHCRRNGSLVE